MPEETSTAPSSKSAEEKPCSSSSAAADSSVDVMEEAKKLIGTGNRHLVMGDVVSAVSVFQDACSMLAAKYGETAYECGEAFFLCGKSLLELARMENSVLGNALEGVPEESEEEEQPENSNIESANKLDEKTRDELRKQVYDAMAEEEKTGVADGNLESEEPTGTAEVTQENSVKSPVKSVTGSEQPSESPVSSEEKSSLQEAEKTPGAPVNAKEESPAAGSHGEETVTEEKVKEQTGDVTATKSDGGQDEESEAEQDKESSEDDDDDDDDEDEEDEEKNGQGKEEEEVGNLQLAWEMLEVAKVIYTRKETKEDQLMAAQAYLKLGEVSAESGNYPQALEDFQECLALQLKHLPPHTRLLAETHYHVATTLCYMDQYNQAIQHYNSSIKVIENRLAMLQEATDAAEGADATSEDKNEMEELKQLLPDIREKVEDAKESERTASTASQAIQQTLGGASTSSAFLCENGGPSSSSAFATASQVPVTPSDSASSSKAISDISHLVRKKRKPEESPVKDTDTKQAKQEASVNGSGDSSASNGSGVQEGESQEPANQSASVESSA